MIFDAVGLAACNTIAEYCFPMTYCFSTTRPHLQSEIVFDTSVIYDIWRLWQKSEMLNEEHDLDEEIVFDNDEVGDLFFKTRFVSFCMTYFSGHEPSVKDSLYL